MSEIVRCGLIQCANPLNDESRPVEEIKEAMFQKHIPLIEQAADKGVQILCLQEIFNGPYFCPSQDARWYDSAEAVPGPTVDRLAEYAKKHEMVIVVPVYEKAMRGVYYNTAAVLDADGSYLGKYRKQHIPQVAGFWEKFFFRPGDGGYPVFKTRYATIGVYICYDRHFPEGARCLGLNGAEIVFNPSATVAGSRSTCGRSSSPPTRWPTATTWGPSTGWAPRPPGTSASSTAPATSSTRGANSWPRAPRTTTRSSWLIWICR